MTPVKLSNVFAPIRKAAREANEQARNAVGKAIYCGQLLNEIKDAIDHGDFLDAVEQNVPEISRVTAWRWMSAARNVIEAKRGDLKELGFDGSAANVALSTLLDPEAPADSGGDIARARQLLFDFTTGKTMKECMAAVIVDGEDAHRITRAHNGKTKGGSKGEDRKNFPAFIGEAFKTITAHLKFWKSYTPGQVETTFAKFACVSKWPTPALAELKKIIGEELKTRG